MHLLAHGGGMGWDEAIVFIAPVVVVLLFSWRAQRRARAAEREAAEDATTTE